MKTIILALLAVLNTTLVAQNVITKQQAIEKLGVESTDSLCKIIHTAYTDLHMRKSLFDIGDIEQKTPIHNLLSITDASIYLINRRYVKNSRTFYSIAVYYQETTDTAGAMDYYTKALYLNNFNEDELMFKKLCYYNRGRIKFKMQDYYGCIADMTGSANVIINDAWLNISNEDTYMYRARSYYLIHNYEESLKDIEYVLKINDKVGVAHYLRGVLWLYYIEDKQKGCTELSRALELGYSDAITPIKKYCR